MAGWFVRRGGKTQGPFASAQLKQFASAGKLKPTDELAQSADGPWTPASKTSLFKRPAEPKAESPAPRPQQLSPVAAPVPTPLTPTVERLPVEAKPPRGSVVVSTLRVFGSVFSSTGGMLARRSQRKHELKLAKIAASGSVAQPAQQAQAAPPSITFAPQMSQTTIMRVTQKVRGGGCGCSGCGCLLMLLLLGLVLAAIGISTPVTP